MNLDSLHRAGLEVLFWSCSRHIKSRYGFDSRIRHMDYKAYSCNTSDVVMYMDNLEFLKVHLDPKDDTVILDSKLVNENLITSVNRIRMGFISKVPAIFSEKVRDEFAVDVSWEFSQRLAEEMARDK